MLWRDIALKSRETGEAQEILKLRTLLLTSPFEHLSLGHATHRRCPFPEIREVCAEPHLGA